MKLRGWNLGFGPASAALAVGLTAGCWLACQDTRAADLSRRIHPHLEAFARYDRWARRLASADHAFRSKRALHEAAFAPLRQKVGVAAAWLERVGPDAGLVAYPSDAGRLPRMGWTKVAAPLLDRLTVQVRRLPRRRTPVLVLRRTASTPDGAELHVAVAFSEQAPANVQPAR